MVMNACAHMLDAPASVQKGAMGSLASTGCPKSVGASAAVGATQAANTSDTTSPIAGNGRARICLWSTKARSRREGARRRMSIPSEGGVNRDNGSKRRDLRVPATPAATHPDGLV
jgi:hypothetical protein